MTVFNDLGKCKSTDVITGESSLSAVPVVAIVTGACVLVVVVISATIYKMRYVKFILFWFSRHHVSVYRKTRNVDNNTTFDEMMFLYESQYRCYFLIFMGDFEKQVKINEYLFANKEYTIPQWNYGQIEVDEVNYLFVRFTFHVSEQISTMLHFDLLKSS